MSYVIITIYAPPEGQTVKHAYGHYQTRYLATQAMQKFRKKLPKKDRPYLVMSVHKVLPPLGE